MIIRDARTNKIYKIHKDDVAIEVEQIFVPSGITTKILKKWEAAYINTLPDKSFLYIAPGGEKDDEGKTTPRGLRYFPVIDENGKLDLPHLRNALARIPQSNLPKAVKDKAIAEARRLLEESKKE